MPTLLCAAMIRSLLFALLCVLNLTACHLFRKEATVVSSHGTAFGERYYSARLVEKLKNVDGPSIKDPAVIKTFKEALTEELIVEGALYAWARANNVHFSDEQLLDYLRTQVGGTAVLSTEVHEAQPSMNLLRDAIYVQLVRRQLQAELVKGVAPSEDDLKKHFEVIRKNLERPRIRIRQILLAEEHEANTLLQNIREKKITFTDAEKKFSVIRGFKPDEELPWVDASETTFLHQFSSAPIGLQGKVYQTSVGYHLVSIVGVKKNANQPFAALRPQVESSYKQKKGEELYLQWLEDQVKTGDIAVDQPRLMAITAEYQESF